MRLHHPTRNGRGEYDWTLDKNLRRIKRLVEVKGAEHTAFLLGLSKSQVDRKYQEALDLEWARIDKGPMRIKKAWAKWVRVSV